MFQIYLTLQNWLTNILFRIFVLIFLSESCLQFLVYVKYLLGFDINVYIFSLLAFFYMGENSFYREFKNFFLEKNFKRKFFVEKIFKGGTDFLDQKNFTENFFSHNHISLVDNSTSGKNFRLRRSRPGAKRPGGRSGSHNGAKRPLGRPGF